MDWFLKRTVEIQQGISTVYFLLSHQDSNLVRQNQKLQCYHYTMRQSLVAFFQKRCKDTIVFRFCKIFRHFILKIIPNFICK